MTPHEQAFLSKLREINGGKVVRVANADATCSRRPNLSDLQITDKLRRLYNADTPWDSIYKQISAGPLRIRKAYHALLASGEIKKRPNNMMKRRLKP